MLPEGVFLSSWQFSYVRTFETAIRTRPKAETDTDLGLFYSTRHQHILALDKVCPGTDHNIPAGEVAVVRLRHVNPAKSC